MNRRAFGLQLTAGLGFGLCFLSGNVADALEETRLRKFSLQIDGVEREALVYVPKPSWFTEAPLVFVFHGHGGGALQASQSFGLAREWPGAISVYMQGLQTPGRLTDPEGKKTGWQQTAGEQNDRDLKFFDGLLIELKKEFKVDPRRIYSTGHSNGGAFTYLLWETRPDLFAAFAPSGAATRNAPSLKPKPALHIAGQADPLVKFEWQKRTMDALRKNNRCAPEGEPGDKFCTVYPSPSGNPFVAFVHPGGHEFPALAPAALVRFFKEHSLP